MLSILIMPKNPSLCQLSFPDQIAHKNVCKNFDRNILSFAWENHSVTHDTKEIY